MGNKMDKVIFPTSDYIEINPPTKSLCGSIVSFSDGGNAPIPSLTASIVPVQDLHGYDSPWAGGAGKNKLAMNISDIKSLNTTGTWNGDTYTVNGAEYKINIDTAGNIISINARSVASNPNGDLKIATTLPANSYILSSGFTETNGVNDTFLQKDGVTIARGNNSSPGPNFTITESSEVVLHIRLSRNDSSFICTPMIRLASVADATFAPYSNECPITGWTEEVVSVRGKNLFDISIDKDTAYTNIYLDKPIGQTITVSAVNNSVTVSESAWVIAFVKKDGTTTYIGDSGYGTPFPQTITATAENPIVKIQYRGITITSGSYDIQAELGSSATTYEPYEGTTTTIDLDGTRYGGTLDVTSGELVVDRYYQNLGDLTWAKITNERGDFFASSGLPNIKTPDNSICSQYKLGNPYGSNDDAIFYAYQGGTSCNVLVRDSRYTDTTAFKTAMNGVQLVYELATPTTFYTQPTSIKSLDGENNVFASTGDVCVTYVTQEYQNLTVNYAETAAKLGSSTVGSITQPIYLNGGTATACTYTLGKSVPSDAVFTDEKVTQTATTTNADYRVLFSGTADSTTRTEGARKDSNLLYNPNSNTLRLQNTSFSNSITPSSISLSNSSGGGISIDNTNNKIEIGKSGTSITYSNTDIVTSNGNTWDGTNTSLKSALTAAVGTDEKVAQTESTTDAEYEITFAGSTGTTATTEGVGKSQYLTFNPYDCVLTTTDGSSGWTSNLTGYDITLSGTNNTWDGTNTSLKDAVSSKLNRTGDKLQTIANQTDFENDSTVYGINMENSSLVNVNAINFNDTCDYSSEAINFKRTNGNWDSLLALDGVLKFITNRTNGAADGTVNNVAFCVGSIKIAAGTKVITVPAAQKYVQIFTNAELNTALGISTGAGQGSTVVYGMNGDYAAQAKYLCGAVYQNVNWFLQTNDGTNLSKGPIRINYIIVKFA